LSTVQQKISGGPPVGREGKDQGIRQSDRASALFSVCFLQRSVISAFVFCPETHVKKVFGNPIFFFQKAVQEKGD
jgi:hypothetical protein